MAIECEMCPGDDPNEADFRIHLSQTVKMHVCRECKEKYPFGGMKAQERKKKPRTMEKSSGAADESRASGRGGA